MEPQDITPGFLTASAVKSLRSLMEMVRYNTQRLDQITGQSEIDVPAKLTAYDADTGAYSWVEQWYDSDGSRVDYDGGRSGGPDYMPAYAVGNGVAPEDWEFPIEVRLRPRINTSLGVVYEFPWNCSCNDGGSRSGSASGSASGSGTASGSVATVDCGTCDGGLASTLYATFANDFTYLGTLPLTYNSSDGFWYSEECLDPCGTTIYFRFECGQQTPTPIENSIAIYAVGIGQVESSFLDTTCNPLFSTISFAYDWNMFCVGNIFSVAITEDDPS